MEIIQEIIHLQNKSFLQKIADDMFVAFEDKELFMKNYHKKHFSFFQVKKQDKTESYQKKIDRCVK
jgi:hypothetical protein